MTITPPAIYKVKGNSFMKNNNENPRFNMLDIIIAMVFFAAVTILSIFLVFNHYSSDKNSQLKKSTEIDYVVTMEIVNNAFYGCIKEGDEVIDTIKNADLGTVVDVKYSDSTFTALNQQTGKLETLLYPDHSKVDITLRAKVKLKEGVYMLGENQITVGSKFNFRVPNFVGEGFCTRINVLN